MDRQSLGRWGEQQAAEHLRRLGYEILAHNVRTPYGEIDLLARQGEQYIFVEVRTRASNSLGPPELSISPRKLAHMRSAAEAYMLEQPEAQSAWRMDMIAVRRYPDGRPPEILHFEDVAAAED
jgi:putative endonuclease